MKQLNLFFGGVLLAMFAISASAKIVTETIEYQIDGVTHTGHIAYEDTAKEKRPGVLVVHEWWGANDYAQSRARELAKEGYVAFALDMYGAGKVTDHPNEAQGFAQETTAKMSVAEERFNTARNILAERGEVQADNIAAIGYCFGGGIVLHMARTGADLKGVASFHGSVATQSPATPGAIKAKIKVYNGAADPFVTAEQLEAFKNEMDTAKADYELINYPGVLHSFTNRQADAFAKQFDMPLAYDAKADKDSWDSLMGFLKEIF